MSVRNTVRSIPALLRVGFLDAVAYRAELLVWILTTTMPLIMMALWSTAAKEAPISGLRDKDFVVYFLLVLIVRQLTSSWAFWQMNMEIRTGVFSTRLLRPVQPLWAYAAENVAALPLRLVVILPLGIIVAWIVGGHQLIHTTTMWTLFGASLFGAWFITLLSNLCIGCLAFYLESSLKVMDVWIAMFFVFSGYLIPIRLFPSGLRSVADWLPFRFQLGLPVEILMRTHEVSEIERLLLVQWAWAFLLLFFAITLWNRGSRRFAAYGG